MATIRPEGRGAGMDGSDEKRARELAHWHSGCRFMPTGSQHRHICNDLTAAILAELAAVRREAFEAGAKSVTSPPVKCHYRLETSDPCPRDATHLRPSERRTQSGWCDEHVIEYDNLVALISGFVRDQEAVANPPRPAVDQQPPAPAPGGTKGAGEP